MASRSQVFQPEQIPNSYVLTTAGTRYQMAMGGAGQVPVPAAARRQYGSPFPNCR